MGPTPAEVRVKLKRLEATQVADLIAAHADKPFTRRAAAAGGVTVEGIRRAGNWWLLQCRVKIEPNTTRTVGLTINEAGEWVCPQITPISDQPAPAPVPASEPPHVDPWDLDPWQG